TSRDSPPGSPDLSAWPTGSREFVNELMLGCLAGFERCMGLGKHARHDGKPRRPSRKEIPEDRGGARTPVDALLCCGGRCEGPRARLEPGYLEGCRTTPN